MVFPFGLVKLPHRSQADAKQAAHARFQCDIAVADGHLQAMAQHRVTALVRFQDHAGGCRQGRECMAFGQLVVRFVRPLVDVQAMGDGLDKAALRSLADGERIERAPQHRAIAVRAQALRNRKRCLEALLQPARARQADGFIKFGGRIHRWRCSHETFHDQESADTSAIPGMRVQKNVNAKTGRRLVWETAFRSDLAC